ncbi:MAG: hypothetical protein FWG60_00300 [Methanomassiliicoccaceae archaeon]|nr:hypothetical protein [Methanomassiliicoccaceae archaeon]
MMIDSILSVMNRKGDIPTDAELSEDVLSINCRKCSKVPDFRSPNCLRCMIHHISLRGNAERIRLRTSKDIELFGPAAEALCELAVFYGSAAPIHKNKDGRSCSECANSCSKLMEIAWSGFPDPNFDSARGRLMSFRPTDSRCNICIQKTYRALDQAEFGINNLKKRISVESARTGGI